MLALESIAQAFIWIGITLGCYVVALFLYRKSGATPLLHPLIVASLIVFLLLTLSDTPISHYQQFVALLDWLLGPAIVALALPLYSQIPVIRRLGGRILIPIFCGGLLAPSLAWAIMALLADNPAMQMTMLVKSITTPLAVEVSQVTRGIPALAAGVVIATGIVGAIASTAVFKALNIQSDAAKGIALGTIGHAIGTVKALQMNETTAAMATLSLCINGITTALIVPIFF